MKRQVAILYSIMFFHAGFAWTTRCPVISQPTKQSFSRTVPCRLNRFLFDYSEVDHSQNPPSVTIPKDDYRTIHASKILNLHNGDTIRSGIVGTVHQPGQLTDQATIQWVPEGKVKRAEPLGNGDPPGSLQLRLHSLVDPPPAIACRVSLILALPRPLQLGRILTMIAQLGVEKLVLVGAHKVPKDYFGSHLFRKPHMLQSKVIEGLCQSGDVTMPEIIVERSVSKFLHNHVDEVFPSNVFVRVIAHPQREGDKPLPRIRNVVLPEPSKRIVVAVGPEGKFQENQ